MSNPAANPLVTATRKAIADLTSQRTAMEADIIRRQANVATLSVQIEALAKSLPADESAAPVSQSSQVQTGTPATA